MATQTTVTTAMVTGKSAVVPTSQSSQLEDFDPLKNDSPPFLFSVRFLLTVMAFMGYCIQYMLKINLGIAIVCMVNNTALQEQRSAAMAAADAASISATTGSLPSFMINNQSSDEAYSLNQTSELKCLFKSSHGHSLDGPFVWSKSLQGFVLASYFYGYLLTQIPGGYLSSRYGGKNILGMSMLFASFLTIVTPFCASNSYTSLSICRFFIGLAHGAFWPAMSSIFTYWAPAQERTKIIGTSAAGSWVGNIIALPLGGYLCVNGFDGGWPSIFYLFGACGIIWSVVFMFVVSDTPATHPFIGHVEREYLLRETRQYAETKHKHMRTPWLEIMKSKICWAIFVAHFCNNWGNYLYLTQLPSFMKDVLHFDIKSNGLMSAIPYIACALVNGVMAIMSDQLLHRGLLSRRNLRRLFTAIGLVIPLIMLICLSFVNCTLPYLGVAFLTLGLAFNGVYWSAGALVNINDIGGPMSGIVFGITNTFGTVPGVISPYIVGLLTKNQTQQEWQIVFIICAAVYLVGAVVFWFFSDSNLQPWATGSSASDGDSPNALAALAAATTFADTNTASKSADQTNQAFELDELDAFEELEWIVENAVHKRELSLKHRDI